MAVEVLGNGQLRYI